MPPRKNLIIPVFIPHAGCPHVCVFCNQNRISGSLNAPSSTEVRQYLAGHLSFDTSRVTIAFYGGSFTGLPAADQAGYLDTASEFIKKGLADGIRLSTRPDMLDPDKVGYLKDRGVRTVELGVQSMDDAVLALSGRGHTASDSERAAGLVKSSGIELGIQLMAGLPGDTAGKFIETVRRVVGLKPSFVRIYPALVVEGSPLAALWRRGEYAPLSLDEAVSLSMRGVKKFREAGIKVIRLGLQPGRELEDSLLAGPYHPAFGHLVESALALERMELAIEGASRMENVEFLVNPAELSVYKGNKSENVRKMSAYNGGVEVSVRADAGVAMGDMRLIGLQQKS
jgi:histone acetyltransferase (RNA polymerase elongator complex component)